jgi:hypothetical protein
LGFGGGGAAQLREEELEGMVAEAEATQAAMMATVAKALSKHEQRAELATQLADAIQQQRQLHEQRRNVSVLPCPLGGSGCVRRLLSRSGVGDGGWGGACACRGAPPSRPRRVRAAAAAAARAATRPTCTHHAHTPRRRTRRRVAAGRRTPTPRTPGLRREGVRMLTLPRCMLTLPRCMLTLPRCMSTLPRCMLTVPR